MISKGKNTSTKSSTEPGFLFWLLVFLQMRPIQVWSNTRAELVYLEWQQAQLNKSARNTGLLAPLAGGETRLDGEFHRGHKIVIYRILSVVCVAKIHHFLAHRTGQKGSILGTINTLSMEG